MENCCYKKICKHAEHDPCRLVFICKFFKNRIPKETPQAEPKKEKRGRKKGFRMQPKFPMTEEGIKAARTLLKERKRDGFLTEEQIAALDQHAHKHYDMLEEIEKQQILDIVKDSNKAAT